MPTPTNPTRPTPAPTSPWFACSLHSPRLLPRPPQSGPCRRWSPRRLRICTRGRHAAWQGRRRRRGTHRCTTSDDATGNKGAITSRVVMATDATEQRRSRGRQCASPCGHGGGCGELHLRSSALLALLMAAERISRRTTCGWMLGGSQVHNDGGGATEGVCIHPAACFAPSWFQGFSTQEAAINLASLRIYIAVASHATICIAVAYA